ncbi:ParB/RepB/Spo0J family partition protein [Microlunatus soli]|uniref:ParB-like nuclease domain-containing protein n=1 Tax=Microlunatus soli TaxID=630515 RepID=A0A1H1ULL1_9ACTN|nr:ParB/RepB/Spo0J family partition protein [Microlunatus soli]SDS73365.1 ParB-like nuclease domain-containing protein [Microlunatus soli]
MPPDAALLALGDGGSMGRCHSDVPLDQVVGSVSRPDDFDADFRPRHRHLADRLDRVRSALAGGELLPPVELIRLGDLYFVADGHHRVAAAREAGRLLIDARVLTICTVAYGMACLRLAHLRSKAAEREFLLRVPLPDPVRRDLWLDRPADWLRLADAAEAWGYRHALECGRPMDRATLAMTWWNDEVVPELDRLRSDGIGVDLRDVELYSTALNRLERVGVGS